MLLFIIFFIILLDINGNDLREKRAISSNMKYKWKFPINYYVEAPVNETVVDGAIKIMMRETCVTFNKSLVPLNNTVGLKFFRGIGCWSITGLFYLNQTQNISLSDRCDDRYGTVEHEIAHSLGLYHEQSRPDRDKYIRIANENVDNNYTINFDKTSYNNSKTYGTQYDYGSGMQYGIYTFSKNKNQTVIPNEEIYSKMIGQRFSLSFNDYKLINMYYCVERLSNNSVKCNNNGYLHPHNSTICKCPNGYAGKYCDKIIKSQHKCGQRIFKLFTKPKYIKGNGRKFCTYYVFTREKYKIKITIKNANTTKLPMCYERLGLEVKYRLDKGAVGACYCGKYENETLISENNKVLIQYTGKTKGNYFKIKVERFLSKN
uniref:Metalloendopeptidase n=1 Tax=Strongyloides venezuelensis TaxID=75913 RepID=A0A0K0FTW3_STRVS